MQPTHNQRISDERIQRCIQWNRNSSRRTLSHSLKENYKAVQHAPHQVAASLKSAYKAELQRLLDAGIIAEVRGHTEWINSIVPVKKPDGSLRLCLDPKDLNKTIKRHHW